MILSWRERSGHGEPTGLVAQGEIARRVIARLKDGLDVPLAAFSVVAARGFLLLIGRADALPWVDGVQYCAPDPSAPSLWLPMLAAPAISTDLLQTALTVRLKQSPLLLWHEPEQILPLDRPITLTASLLDWLDKEFE
jgi:hypothetical protein